jgi:hypothetical protein
MKKFTLLTLLLSIFTFTFGQVLTTAGDAHSRQNPTTLPGWSSNTQKGGGDVIWSTTFNWKNASDPRGWTLPDGWTIKDNTDKGNLWQWRDDTIKGNFTSEAPPSFFATKEDGFLALPMDEYNSRDGVTTYDPADTYIETPPINCSGVSSVVVKFTQYFRLCCQNYNIEMLVTNDGGVHWASYDVRYAVAGNTATPERFRNVVINISDVAAGLANVQVRFYMHGPDSYYWLIDDLQFTEAYQNDLVLEDFWLDFDGGSDAGVGHINYWPISQMGMPGATSGTVGNYFFKGALLNNGVADAENARINVKVQKNGSEIFSTSSPQRTIWSLERDTQNVADPFLAVDYGDYRFDYLASMDNGEEVPSNNSVSLYFTVNDTLAHRADFSAESASSTGGWVGGDNAGDMVGVSYDIYAPCEINTITAYLGSFTASQSPQFQFILFKDIDGNYEELITCEVTDMDSTYMSRWVTMPVIKDGETEFLQPGNYAVCVKMWGTDPSDPTNGSNGLTVGWDMTTKASNTLMYQAVGGNWYSTGVLDMIGFTINASGGPTEAPVTFNVNMNKHIASGEFKPGTDFVDVAGTFNNWSGSAHLTDPEADGIYTITLPGIPVGKVIEYKYRINGDWNTSEYPNGGPNRKYTVRYWNVLNNTYNSGNTSGNEQASLFNTFSVYPNPTAGAFTVDMSNAKACDLVITLTNIQGQVVYQNKVANALDHQETIGENLSKGLYFLTVNNGKEVKTQKVIVQ